MKDTQDSKELSPEDIRLKSIEHARRCLMMIRGENRNETKRFIDRLTLRQRSYIYFSAGLSADKNRLTYQELDKYDRKKVIVVLREFKDIFTAIPKILSDADIEVK